MRERLSVRGVWVLPVTSVLVPLLLLVAVAWHDHRETVAAAERHVDRTTQVLFEHTVRAFETFAFAQNEIDNRIRPLSWPEVAASEDIHRALKRIVTAFPQIGALWLVDGQGRTMAANQSFPAPAVAPDLRDFPPDLRVGPEGLITGTHTGRVTGKPTFNVVRARTRPDGTADGAIVVSAFIGEFQEFFARVAASPGDHASLVRADGTILCRYPDGNLVRLTPHSALIRAAAAAPEGGSFRTVAEGDGVERLFAFRRLGTAPVYVVYARSIGAVEAQWRSHVLFFALFAVPSSLLLGGVSWLVVRKERSERAAHARAAEEAARREKAEDLLRKIQRLELLGQIAGGIAHDFNNLLMVITSNLYLAQTRGGGEDGPAGPFIDTAMQAAYRGGQLTQQLLTFARQQTLKPEVVDLNRALASLVDGMLKRSLRGDIAVETDLAPDLWPVEIDRAQLELAVLNLAVNARDAMPDGGRLTVRTRNLTRDGAPAGLAGEFVALSVGDTGCGIAPEIRDRVFDPFFTTKDVGKGTGLGLSQVYGFATQAGGTVTVDSAPGAGTTFTLHLPRSRREAALPAAPTAAAPLPEGRGRRILLVEDSPEVGRTTATLLEGLGYAVTAVDTADRALEILDAGGRFELVFSDIVMPGTLNGLELARTVRRRFPELPVLLTTGYSNAASTATQEGGRLLHKPYRPEILAEALRDLLRVRA